MTGDESDYWNVSVSGSYTATLNDTLTVSSGNQELGIWAESSLNDVNSNLWIWSVTFVNSTSFSYWVNTGGGNGPGGTLNCINGVVYVVVSPTSIEFIGSSSKTIDTNFQSLVQMQTFNGESSSFNGGKLIMTLSLT